MQCLLYYKGVRKLMEIINSRLFKLSEHYAISLSKEFTNNTFNLPSLKLICKKY